MFVCNIIAILGMMIPSISHHLGNLIDRGLLVSQKDAQTIYYSLNVDYEHLLFPLFDVLYNGVTME